jgi:uncharacterized protein (TIGR03437 family)
VPAFSIVADPPLAVLTSVNSASYSTIAIAPASIASLFGKGLAPGVVSASSSLTTSLDGVEVSILDFNGISSLAELLVVSPSQVNFVLDPATNVGPAVVTVTDSGQTVASGVVIVSSVAPGIFSANSSGAGVAAATVQIINGSEVQLLPTAVYDPKQKVFVGEPIDLGSSTTLVFLDFYGTGFRNNSSIAAIRVSAAGVSLPVVYAGAQSQFTGLDQLVVGPIPRSLAGKGALDVSVVVDGISANSVSVTFK